MDQTRPNRPSCSFYMTYSFLRKCFGHGCCWIKCHLGDSAFLLGPTGKWGPDMVMLAVFDFASAYMNGERLPPGNGLAAVESPGISTLGGVTRCNRGPIAWPNSR